MHYTQKLAYRKKLNYFCFAVVVAATSSCFIFMWAFMLC